MLRTDTEAVKRNEEAVDDRTLLRGKDAAGLASQAGVGAALAPSLLKSRFVLEAQLGSGGMGTVYRAKDLRKVEAQDDEPYLAIKVLNSGFRERPNAFIALQREAAKSQSLLHRNIVKIFDFDKDGDVPFMTMELLRGNELSELLTGYPNGLPDTLAWPLIRGFCSALSHAHTEGVIHADLKPGNLFVTHTGELKIFDFGIARAVHPDFSRGVLETRCDLEDLVFDAGELRAFTPAYASPALLSGGSPNASDDVFAAALVIYQMLTGRHPYNRIPANKVDRRGFALERPAQLSSRRWRALSAALELDEAKRLPSVALLMEALFETSRGVLQLLAIALGVSVIALLSFTQQKNVASTVTRDALQGEAGVEQILELIENPSFDEAWETEVGDELTRLANEDLSSHVLVSATSRISNLYAQKAIESPDLQEAVQLAEQGEKFNHMSVAWESIAERSLGVLERRLDNPAPTYQWLVDTEAALATLSSHTKTPHLSALAQHDTNMVYLNLLRSHAAELSETAKDFALAILELREFDRDALDAVRESLSAAGSQNVPERVLDSSAQRS